MRIAYVEDNPTNLALVERVASMNKHVIVSYTEGEIAQKELMREKFDLILMDVELAGEIGGLQVVRSLRAQGLTTPIIAVTAYAMLGDRDRCIEAGCDDYLPKPLPIPQLLATLNRYDELVKNPVPAGAVVAASAAAAVSAAPPPVTTAPASGPTPVSTTPVSVSSPAVSTPVVTPPPIPASGTPPGSVTAPTPAAPVTAAGAPAPVPQPPAPVQTTPAAENKESLKETPEAPKAATEPPAVPPAPQNPKTP